MQDQDLPFPVRISHQYGSWVREEYVMLVVVSMSCDGATIYHGFLCGTA